MISTLPVCTSEKREPPEDFASGQPKASCEWAAKHILRWAKHSFAGEQPDCTAK